MVVDAAVVFGMAKLVAASAAVASGKVESAAVATVAVTFGMEESVVGVAAAAVAVVLDAVAAHCGKSLVL